MVKKAPTGKLFRKPHAAAWSLASISNECNWLLRRPKVVACRHDRGGEPTTLKQYNCPHSFLTQWVEDGGDIYIAAQLCGISRSRWSRSRTGTRMWTSSTNAT